MTLLAMSTTSEPLTEKQEEACMILSELFLDIEFTAEMTDAFRSSIKDTTVELDMLEHILRIDLFPILYPNILFPYKWVGFDRDWLIHEVNSNRTGQKTWAQVLFRATLSSVWCLWYRIMFPTWVKVKEKLKAKIE